MDKYEVWGVEWDSGTLLSSCFPFYISCGGGDDEVGGGLEGGWGHHRVLLWENCLTLQPAECFQPSSSLALAIFGMLGSIQEYREVWKTIDRFKA